MKDRLHALPPPPFVQRIRNETRAIENQSVQTALDAVPARDLARLRDQLTPLAKRVCTAEDRHEFTRIIQEWGMRGLPGYVPSMLMEKLYDEYRAVRSPEAGAFRRRYERLYAPWFATEPKPANPGLRAVERPRSGPATSVSEGFSDALEAALTPKDPAHRFFHRLVRTLCS
jgi:hypothetical protein